MGHQKTTKQMIEELTATVIEMREAPVMNGGFRAMMDTVSELKMGFVRLDERLDAIRDVESQRHIETLKWREVAGDKLEDVRTRVTTLEAKSVPKSQEYVEKWKAIAPHLWKIALVLCIAVLLVWGVVSFEQLAALVSSI